MNALYEAAVRVERSFEPARAMSGWQTHTRLDAMPDHRSPGVGGGTGRAILPVGSGVLGAGPGRVLRSRETT